jgi:enoyl-[acyl-carrier protein] reductase I
MNARIVENRTFDEVAIGDNAQLVRTLLPEDIEVFAAVSGDVNPAHLDPVYAAGNRFHKVVGHGMWAGALISAVLGTKLPGAGTIYLGQNLRFMRPVGIGDTVTVTVTAREKDAARKVIYFDCRCTNQQGEDVVTGTAEVLAPLEKIRRPAIDVPEVAVAHRQRYRERLDAGSLPSRSEEAGEASTEHSAGPASPRLTPLEEGSVTAPFSLRGRRGLVLGIANEHSIAYGCARAFRVAGAELAVTYVNDKAKPFVAPLAEELGCSITAPCDVRIPGQLEALFERIEREWGGLDFVLHSIAYAPKEDLHGRVTDCSAAGFAMAMDVSCHSFIRIARLAEPLMRQGGCLLTVSFYGSERVVEHYNLMGPVKAALESTARYLAAELGPQDIRVHAISPGPMRTRAASGLDRFDELLERAAAQAPQKRLAGIDDVGALAAYLVGDGGKMLTGTVIPVDGGQHVMAG